MDTGQYLTGSLNAKVSEINSEWKARCLQNNVGSGSAAAAGLVYDSEIEKTKSIILFNKITFERTQIYFNSTEVPTLHITHSMYCLQKKLCNDVWLNWLWAEIIA